jgi:iron complex transport system substrate-binding protein
MDRLRKICAGVVVGLTVLIFCHVGHAAQKHQNIQQTQRQPTAALPVSLVDAAARKVVLKSIPSRIVVVGKGSFMALHLLYMFPEAGGRIVGFEDRRKMTDFAKLIDPAFSAKTLLNQDPGPEQIASLKPDVVIMKGSLRDQTSDSLERLGISVVFLGMETPEQFQKDVDNLGLVLGNRVRAEEIKAYYQGRLALIRDRVSGIPEKDKPGMLMLMYTERGSKVAVEVPAGAWMQTIQVRAAGARPVWLGSLSRPSNNWTVVNFEQIALWNPDTICVIVPHEINPADLIASLKKDPQWRLLRAVKSGRMHAYPSDIFGWDNPDPRWILGMIWTARTAWPDRFRDVSMRDEVMRFFTTLYRMDSTGIAKDILPKCSLAAGE